MKPLSHVEPRTAISQMPYTITEPGSYYLTTNLTCNGDGITIRANRVTLDLMGFSITGTGTGSGVFVDGAAELTGLSEVAVRNGHVNDYEMGVRVDFSQRCSVEDMTVTECDSGIVLNGSYTGRCTANRVSKCAVANNLTHGIHLTAANYGRCEGNTISDCAVSDQGFYNGGEVFLPGRSICLDGTLGSCSGNTIERCAIRGCSAIGIDLIGGLGMCKGNLIVRNVITLYPVTDGTLYGIRIGGGFGNRVEDNTLSNTINPSDNIGIRCEYGNDPNSSGNFVFKNTCFGFSTGFSLTPNDTYGPIVTSAGELASSGAAAHPLANFSR